MSIVTRPAPVLKTSKNFLSVGSLGASSAVSPSLTLFARLVMKVISGCHQWHPTSGILVSRADRGCTRRRRGLAHDECPLSSRLSRHPSPGSGGGAARPQAEGQQRQ